MPSCAIFDLDRTLIPSSSGTVFQRHLRECGLGPDRDIPLAGLFEQIYRTFGENRLSMEVARHAVKASRGWPVADVARAAENAVDDLLEQVLPYVPVMLAEHREGGRTLVMATTSPVPLVQPLADAMGFDVVLATRWQHDDGCYTGELDGPFVWGREKMLATRKWAGESGIDLRSSYAYSDSFKDSPLLAEVGHPVAVNPDPPLLAMATLQGWPVRHFDVPPGVSKLGGREIQEWLRPLNRPEVIGIARFEFDGVENIPSRGPAILTFNHRSYFDSTVVNLLMAKAGRPARFLGKKEVFDVPVVGRLASMVGGIRVDRSSGSNEPLERAADALRAGQLIAMAPQGTIPRGPAFFDPELKARWGAARLAAMSDAPVIPVGLWGTEKVWPRNQRLPNLDLLAPPTISVAVGNEVSLGREDPETDTKAIMAAIVDLLPDEAREPRTPTEEELGATYPAGYEGDPTAEAERRPGTDT
jgi:putative phosphoserine phosphatase/1-acylglycerol-3-phosphate O-acyltransferase